jgi:hypothetical protein
MEMIDARIYIDTLLQSNALEAQEVHSPARNELLWGYGKPHRILRHNLRRIGQFKVGCALLDAFCDCELSVFFDNSLKGLRLVFSPRNTAAVCRFSEAC